MQNQFDIFTLKGQAAQLQKGLAALNKPITRTQALDLTAQMQGKRDWKELTGLAQAANLPEVTPLIDVLTAVGAGKKNRATPREYGSAQDLQRAWKQLADTQDEEARQAQDSAWLNRLFYVLRLTVDTEELQEVLDNYVLALLPPHVGASVNNQGMQTQLAVLLEEEQFNRKALVRSLEQELNRKLAMPEGTPSLAMLPERVIEASLMVCYGFPEEMEHQFDALEWALQATAEDLAAVVRGNYRNCDATDEIGLWMEQHAPNLEERAKIHKMLEAMRTIVDSKPDRTGITLEVDANSFGHLVWLRHQYDGLQFDDALIELLDIDKD